MSERQVGDLQVWWIPQVPGIPFEVDVSSVEEGVRIMDVLADYDAFQYANNIKPDYCNAGGLRMWTEDRFGQGDWEDWYCETGGEWFDDPRDWLESLE